MEDYEEACLPCLYRAATDVHIYNSIYVAFLMISRISSLGSGAFLIIQEEFRDFRNPLAMLNMIKTSKFKCFKSLSKSVSAVSDYQHEQLIAASELFLIG